jgi:hypothetical protein
VIVGALVILGVVLAVVFTQGGGSSSSGTTGSTTTTSTTASDPAVVDLQKVMIRLGYYSGPVDGVYGDATTAAVTDMQKALGVTPDGTYGPATDAALKGKAKDVVVQIQTELAKYGYYTGPIDGHYGQKDSGLKAPDGSRCHLGRRRRSGDRGRVSQGGGGRHAQAGEHDAANHGANDEHDHDDDSRHDSHGLDVASLSSSHTSHNAPFR